MWWSVGGGGGGTLAAHGSLGDDSGSAWGFAGGGFDVGGLDETAYAEARRFRRLDLRLVPYESYHAATLYFTGSDEHNKLMRSRAIEKGMRLSEYGLFRVDADGKESATPEAVSCEEDIFKLLDMAYREPSDRDI